MCLSNSFCFCDLLGLRVFDCLSQSQTLLILQLLPPLTCSVRSEGSVTKSHYRTTLTVFYQSCIDSAVWSWTADLWPMDSSVQLWGHLDFSLAPPSWKLEGFHFEPPRQQTFYHLYNPVLHEFVPVVFELTSCSLVTINGLYQHIQKLAVLVCCVSLGTLALEF